MHRCLKWVQGSLSGQEPLTLHCHTGELSDRQDAFASLIKRPYHGFGVIGESTGGSHVSLAGEWIQASYLFLCL